MLTFRTLFPVVLDEDAGGGGGDAPAADDIDLDGIDLDAIAPEGGDAPDPEWAEPAELPEGVDQFDREYVEGLRAEAARYRTRARDAHDQFDGLDADAARDALAWKQELQTEAGVIKMFYDAGHSLGLGDKEIERLFKDPDAPPAEEEDDSDLDLPVTMRELRQFLADEVLKPQREQVEQQRQAEFQVELKARIDGVFDELSVTEAERGAVAALADQLIDPSKGDDAAAIEQAVRDATAQWNAAAEARVKAYVEGKRKAAAKVPKTPDGGAPPAGEAEAEPPPRSVQEVIDRRRARERAARGE